MKIENQTINGGNQQFADKIVNKNKNITATNYVEGNVSGGNIAGGDIHITTHNSLVDNNPKPAQKTILIAAAAPSDEARLRLDVEVRDIEEGLRLAEQRDQFLLEKIWATRVRDLRRAMQTHKPTIVHFCGHGTGEQGIVLEDNQGKAQLVSSDALASFFELFIDSVECVVLNACFSDVQAKGIVKYIPYVIGMTKAIGDQAAIEFAVAFYDSLAAGDDYERAYKVACSAIAMQGISGHLIPELFKKVV
jgi:hypothetical protein